MGNALELRANTDTHGSCVVRGDGTNRSFKLLDLPQYAEGELSLELSTPKNHRTAFCFGVTYSFTHRVTDSPSSILAQLAQSPFGVVRPSPDSEWFQKYGTGKEPLCSYQNYHESGYCFDAEKLSGVQLWMFRIKASVRAAWEWGFPRNFNVHCSTPILAMLGVMVFAKLLGLLINWDLGPRFFCM